MVVGESGIQRGADGVARYAGLVRNVVRGFADTVAAHPDRVAVVELDGGTATYRELWDRSARVAGGLRASGVAPGDRVAIGLPNGPAWVLAFWGAQLAGAVVVPLNTRLAPVERDVVLADSGAPLAALAFSEPGGSANFDAPPPAELTPAGVGGGVA